MNWGDTMYKSILLAADGSEHSFRAAEQALKLANHSAGKVVIVYVVSEDTSKSEVLQSWNSAGVADKRKEKISKIEEEAKKKGINYEYKILRGEPGPAVVKYANENNMDIVVIGSRGLNTLQEMVLGSVSHKVAKRVNCPVMIVK